MNTMNEHDKNEKKYLMKEKSTSLLEFIVVSCSSTHNKLIVCIALGLAPTWSIQATQCGVGKQPKQDKN